MGWPIDERIHLQVNFRDQSPNDSVRRRRLQVIERAAAEVGWGQTAFRPEPGYETGNAPDERFDIKAARRRQPATAGGSK